MGNTLLIKCASTLQWKQNTDEFTVYCVTLEQSLLKSDQTFMRPFVSICNHLQIQLDCPAFTVNDTMAIVANLTQMGIDEPTLTQRLAHLCHELHLVAGASGVYRGAHSLRGCYQRAFEAMRSLMVAPANYPVLRFDERAVTIALSFIADRINPEQFCSRAMLNLAYHHPDLYETLDTYLRLNCNANEASKALGVQRSTFVYRLSKARELTEVNLDDYNERLLLMLSCKLVELFGIEKLMPD